MNPLAIVMTVGITAATGLAVALVGYFTYQALHPNESNQPHRVNRTSSINFRAVQSGPNLCRVGECTICHKQIGSVQRKTLSCNHMFHRVCIDNWQGERENRGKICPICPICTICLDEVKPQTSHITLRCKHVFHTKCIRRWLELENTCPNCKKQV